MEQYEEELKNLLIANENRQHYFINQLREKFNSQAAKHVCIFGAGELGMYLIQEFKKHFPGMTVDFFCDNNPSKWGEGICNGIKCISFKELKGYREDVLVIIASQFYKEIESQLKKEGFSKLLILFNLNYLRFNFIYSAKIDLVVDKISAVMNILADDESKRILVEKFKYYLQESPVEIDFSGICLNRQGYADVIYLDGNESFVDAGAFDGDTINQFLQECKYKFANVYAFEMDKDNYQKLEHNIKQYNQNIQSKTKCFKLGLWNEPQQILYNNRASAVSKISKSGLIYSNIDALDNILKDQPVTLIKMDIEGAEIKALEGASEIIRAQKPKLAISIYHKIEHLWEIPLLIHEYVPEYKLYIRHHTKVDEDTICYAVL